MKGDYVLIDSHNGQYIPQIFVEDYDGWHNISEEDKKVLLSGPFDNPEAYWSAWYDVINNAYYIDSVGNRWVLYEDGDLFVLCESKMNQREKNEFFEHIYT